MHRLQLHYTLSRQAEASARVHHPLITLLAAVDAGGSISAAARTLGLSYRHVWGELKRWEAELGDELLVWDKGQAARLSAFGAKLMWAERQAQARLAPQIEALRAELERCYALAFDPQAQVLALWASSDEVIAALRQLVRGPAEPSGGESGVLHLDVRYGDSIDALRALNEGRCALAGLHTVLGADAHSPSARRCKPLLRPGQHKVIGLAQRSLGLMLAAGNPLGVHGWADLLAQRARWAQQAQGSATRLAQTELLARAGLADAALRVVLAAEPSPAAVAQAVAAGQADAALGSAAAAAAAGLDFVPLAQEGYHLVCLKDALDSVAVITLRLALQQAAWAQALAGLPGCAPLEAGRVRALSRVLPWWHLRPKTPVNASQTGVISS